MSFIDSLFKKSKLDNAVNLVAKARKREGAEAEHLFKTAYKGFAEVIENDLLYSQTLYHWGFALLHQARLKSGDEAARLYEEAIAKFSFCQTINASFLGAAIDSGVACMDLARVKGVDPNDKLYEMAKAQFERANAIQQGTASYNLACIHALRNNEEACLNALEDSRDHGSLPANDDILNDPDLDSIKHHLWFMDFMSTLESQEKNETQDVDITATEEIPQSEPESKTGNTDESEETRKK
ncbi:MAG: TPR end-of-group domain-containing protein [Gammaproteobacteria bacterium]